MSKNKAFLSKANEFAKMLVAHASRGIAMRQTFINDIYETIHREYVEGMFPLGRIPLSSFAYMDIVKQLTNAELVPYFSFMKQNGMYVVDPNLSNQPSTNILRVPPSPLVIPYKTLQYDTSVEKSKFDSIKYVGRAGQLINEENVHIWNLACHSMDYDQLGKEKTMAYQQLETLFWLLCALDKDGRGHLKNERLNLAGNSLPVFMYGRGGWTRPDFLYDKFANLHLLLSQAETYVFTHGVKNVWTDFLARSQRMLIQPEHTINTTLSYEVEKQKMWAQYNNSPKPSLRMVWG